MEHFQVYFFKLKEINTFKEADVIGLLMEQAAQKFYLIRTNQQNVTFC